MDRLGSLNAFMQSAEARSFTAAARQMGISSSAVGKAVSRLEERLGVRLFHRSTRSITLTPEGALFLNRCTRIFGEIEAAEMELALANSSPRGRLRVSLPMIGMLLMPALIQFAKAYPDIELDLDFTDRIVDVIDEGFDAVIRTGNVTDSNLMTRTLGAFRYVIVASPDYLARHGTPRTPIDLLSHACLQHRFPSTGKLERWPLSEDGEPLEMELPVSTIASTIEPLVKMAAGGLGLTCVPDFSIRRELREGTLVPLLADYLTIPGALRILWPSSRHVSPKIKAFVDHMGDAIFANGNRRRTGEDENPIETTVQK